MTRNTKRASTAALLAALVAAATSVASSSTDVIRDRQQAMKDVGGAMQNLATIAKKETPFEAGVVRENAAVIAEALKRSADLFPEGSDKGAAETWAKPEIWSRRGDFSKKLETAQAEAVAMQSVGTESAFSPALAKLGDACKACHQAYRRPRE